MAAVLPLTFDSSRPIGPLEEDETCTFGPKTVRFDAKKSTGYTHGMQLTALGNEPEKHHVFSLKLTGLKQEYGFNAVAVVMDKFDGLRSQDDMFRKERGAAHNHGLWICSQFTCPWPNTLMTLVVSPGDSNVDVFVEPTQDAGVSDSSKKRKHEEHYGIDAMPYMPKDETDLWTDLGDGLKCRSFKADFMAGKMPNIGVKMCGSLGNRAEIVSPSQRAIASKKRDAASLVLYK